MSIGQKRASAVRALVRKSASPKRKVYVGVKPPSPRK